MAPAAKGKKQRSTPSMPCEVFFACTLCGCRSRTVPQLHSHYRSSHKGQLNIKSKAKSKGEEIITIEDDDDGSTQGSASSSSSSPGKKVASPLSVGEDTLSQGSSPRRGADMPPLKDEAAGSSSMGKKRKTSGDASEKGKEKLPRSDTDSKARTPERAAESEQQERKADESASDQKAVEESRDSAKATCGSPGHSAKTNSTSSKGISQKWSDSTITRKRNVPLGMLKGKKKSLMVIFQHADQTKPLPEGSSFKLRNAGGEQTYMVVANVDVDIIETHRRASSKSK